MERAAEVSPDRFDVRGAVQKGVVGVVGCLAILAAGWATFFFSGTLFFFSGAPSCGVAPKACRLASRKELWKDSVPIIAR